MSKKFTIKIMDQVFESDEDGMLDLNDIHKGLNLPKNRAPSQWRDKKVVDKLKHYANLQIARKSTTYNQHNTLIGDEKATVAYAMWVSYEFYSQVLDAFVALRQGNLTKAVEIAADTMSESDAHYLKRQARIKGMVWSEACAYSGIYHANKCRDMLMDHPKFKYFEKVGNSKFFVTEDGEAIGYFYNRGNKFSSNTTLRVTPEGREWLRENRDWFNNATETYINTPEGLH